MDPLASAVVLHFTPLEISGVFLSSTAPRNADEAQAGMMRAIESSAEPGELGGLVGEGPGYLFVPVSSDRVTTVEVTMADRPRPPKQVDEVEDSFSTSLWAGGSLLVGEFELSDQLMQFPLPEPSARWYTLDFRTGRSATVADGAVRDHVQVHVSPAPAREPARVYSRNSQFASGYARTVEPGNELYADLDEYLPIGITYGIPYLVRQARSWASDGAGVVGWGAYAKEARARWTSMSVDARVADFRSAAAIPPEVGLQLLRDSLVRLERVWATEERRPRLD